MKVCAGASSRPRGGGLTGLAPLGAIAAVALIPPMRPPAVRMVAALVFAVAGAWTTSLAYRHPEVDVRVEHWPNREFMLEMSERTRVRAHDAIRLGLVADWREHPFVNPANMQYEAGLLGLELTASAPWQKSGL